MRALVALLVLASTAACRHSIASYRPSPETAAPTLSEERERLSGFCRDDFALRHLVRTSESGEFVWFRRYYGIGWADAFPVWAYERDTGHLAYYRFRKGTSDVYTPCLSDCIHWSRGPTQREYGTRPAEYPEAWADVCPE